MLIEKRRKRGRKIKEKKNIIVENSLDEEK